MTTFTVLNRHGEVQTQNASLSEAAQTVLWHDGHDYEFRADGYWLESTACSRCGHARASVLSERDGRRRNL